MIGEIPPATGCSCPVRPGNSVTVLVGGEAAFSRIREAVLAAESSVWVTVAFVHPPFRFPGTDESLFDLLDLAADRGVDVRVIFWRHNDETAHFAPETFAGDDQQHAMLHARGTSWSARWDRAAGGNCHHQKSWLIDTDGSTPTAFVGGMNLTPATLVDHEQPRSTHDVYSELRGPACVDVAHNFVQRWNEASERAEPLGRSGPRGHTDLTHPTTVPSAIGDAAVQVQRTIGPGLYAQGAPAVGHASFPIGGGERSIHEQYLAAIASAERTIVVENQSLLAHDVLDALHAAAGRGVSVSMIVPYWAERRIQVARSEPEWAAAFHALESLARQRSVTLAGMVPQRVDGRIHVHSKVMTIDDRWTTIGSCNMRTWSFTDYSELNVSVWDESLARSVRTQLFDKHLGEPTGHLTDREAHRRFAEIAGTNRDRHAAGHPHQGFAVEIDAARYGIDT